MMRKKWQYNDRGSVAKLTVPRKLTTGEAAKKETGGWDVVEQPMGLFHLEGATATTTTRARMGDNDSTACTSAPQEEEEGAAPHKGSGDWNSQ